MNLFDAFASSPYACEIITRSDHMPSKLERYADWARKFYGGGYHESSKDSRESIDYVVRRPFAAPALVH
ncbi:MULTISPECIES: hypothetical protein [unclassified Rhodanobacter]|jgi:hypothetical protein|uniref:Uncharacterized protein n=1 Tax=Rhodanobacter humi TaxID=1888173 RepID=A0ABV4AP42_9GAMM